MKRLLIIFFVFVFTSTIKSQPQTIFGMDAGLSIGSPKYLDFYKFETGANIFFTYKLFACKAQFAIQPVTKFGIKTFGFIALGLTTPADKVFSWHILLGPRHVFAQRNSYTPPDIPPSLNNTTTFDGGFDASLSTGFYIRPFKMKNILIGIDADYYLETYTINNISSFSYHIISFSASLCYCFNLNKEK